MIANAMARTIIFISVLFQSSASHFYPPFLPQNEPLLFCKMEREKRSGKSRFECIMQINSGEQGFSKAFPFETFKMTFKKTFYREPQWVRPATYSFYIPSGLL